MTTAESTTPDSLAPELASADTLTTEGAPLAPEQVAPLIEALLFVADGPVEESALARVLGLTRRQIEAPLAALGAALRERGLRLQRGPDGAQLVTAPAAASYIEQFLGLEAARKLSPAALETLAIIAYRQPVTRGTLEAIRGVSCDGPIDTLRTRGLIDVAGRADGPGRPTLFATTQKFLEHFGLERAEDLPALPPEVAELAAALPERAEQLALDVMGALVSEDDAGAAAAEHATGAVPPVEHPEPNDDTELAWGAPQGPSLPGAPTALPSMAGGSFVPPSANRAVLPPGNAGLPLGG
jgi:segregation and condensation protein B